MDCLSRKRNRVWGSRSFLPSVVGLYGFPIIASTPSRVTSCPMAARGDRFSAAPLSLSSRCGTPCA